MQGRARDVCAADHVASFSASGVNYFYGGDVATTAAESHNISQAIDVSLLATDIDAGTQAYDASGLFGGWSNQNDTCAMTCTFLNSSGGTLGAFTIGNVTAADRKNVTKLLLRSASGNVPKQTRAIHVTLTFNKIADGTFNDGSADNLSLVLR